ncbi:MarR family winged helix-turn-helix transcriptional regulator [Beijerinckia sp. L45]|uniref:MarR family winged helix-turn-helix transcriptional regulator n=1 Tax=Beijerinckia sp. L45 TaxID=1641855 RepID=UPI00131E4008|nr:MarR family winged helix-turn-helix transcriptional regulator [Beijerinckia sp. L45]
MYQSCKRSISICNNFGNLQICCRLVPFYDAILAQSGLGVTQVAHLQRMRQLGRRSIAELADLAELDRAALSQILRPLLHADVIEMAPSRSDPSVKHLGITEKGEVQLRHAERLWRDAQARCDTIEDSGQASMLRAVFDAMASSEAPQRANVAA